MAMLDNTVVNVALPTIRNDLGAGFSQLQWIVDAYALAFASLLLTGGILGDRYGRKRMFLAGLVVFTVFSFACGLSTTPTQLIVARALQGVGGALLIPGTLSIITVTFPPHERAKALGHLGRRLGHRARARTDARRLHGRAPRLGVGVLPERADRHHRVPRRDVDGARIAVRGAAPARHRGPDPGHLGAVLRDVRADRGQRAGLERPQDHRLARAVRGPDRGVPPVGADEPATR